MDKREFLQLLGAGAVAGTAGALLSQPAPQTAQNNVSIKKEESVYDRVMRTGKIRCGYGVYNPLFFIDPNTGEFSGLFYEITERIGKILGLEIEWSEDAGWGGAPIEGLRTNRFDMVSTIYPNAERGVHIDFSMPFFYSGLGVYVRNNDHRFDNNLERLNSPDVKIATMDGEMSAIIAATEFPRAKVLSVPQLTEFTFIPMNVVERKADVTFMDEFIAQAFLKNHPGTLRNITEGQPIRVFENPFSFKRGEFEFARMINIAIAELHNNGEIERLLRKYDGHHTGFYPVAKPYGNWGS